MDLRVKSLATCHPILKQMLSARLYFPCLAVIWHSCSLQVSTGGGEVWGGGAGGKRWGWVGDVVGSGWGGEVGGCGSGWWWGSWVVVMGIGG